VSQKTNANYYARHAEKLKERFKKRYKTDPEFRADHIAKVAQYKKRKAREKKELKERTQTERKIWRTFKVNGVDTPCCRLGHLALSLERSVQTIRLWEDDNRFPKSIRYKNQRYYTKGQYDYVLSAWSRSRGNLEKFFADVTTNWNNIPLQ
jgi:hypothetical protein